MATRDFTVKPPALSKTMQAIAYMQKDKVNAADAAKRFGITPTAVYRKLKSLEATENRRCPCCNQVIREYAE